MPELTRRTVARGAAWSIPAITVASEAPALAASTTGVACASAGLTWTATGLKTYSPREGAATADTATFGGSSDNGLGTRVELHPGQLAPMTAPTVNGTPLTQYRIDWAGTSTVRTASGGQGEYDVLSTTPASATWPVGTNGDPQTLIIDTAVPYHLIAKKAANYIVSISTPFKIAFFDDAGTEYPCTDNPTYYLNACYPAQPDAFGNFPDSGNLGNYGAQWSVSTNAPADACGTADLSCTVMSWTDTGIKMWDDEEGTRPADMANSGGATSSNGKGARYTISLANLAPAVTPNSSTGATITQYRITWLRGTIAQPGYLRSASGFSDKLYGASSVTTLGGSGIHELSAPMPQTVSIESSIPFHEPLKKAGNYLESISLPFTVEFFDENGVKHQCSDGTTPTYFLNVCYQAAPDVFGYYPDSGYDANGGAAWTVTTGAVNIC